VIRLQYHELGSVVSIGSDYGQDDGGFDSCQRQRIFPVTSVSRLVVGPTQPPEEWVLGGRAFPGGKLWPGHGTDHSPPSSAKVKEE
jgi:hypothetical protein